MTLTRFGEIKRNINLWNNDAAKARYQEGYNTAYNFYLPYKDLVVNTNTISVKDDENQVIDESSGPHCGYGDAGSGIFVRLYQNNKCEKGWNTVMCIYYGRFQIYMYMNHHKLYNHKKQGWQDAGPYEHYTLQCDFLEMISGSMSSNINLFHDKPTTTVEKYFVTDAIIDWAGNEGLGITGTNTRNIPPKDIEPLYLHNEKKNATMKHEKAARFSEPIVSVKND